ncbi:hypothetical protein [Spirosoma endbachense]|uniref:Uncharacterized protein n=1 Tax=Spirosoma endbachense TaxID=2666025 RepID=A0A6P1VY32_9BACT|nr:hypothetical protein [Spirosoma endbachense]QHV97554.1 hypothetical protein GJR95_22220 [Spirosoma endbachense]
MKKYRFHYRTLGRGIKGVVNVNAENFADATRLFFESTKRKSFRTFYVEFP